MSLNEAVSQTQVLEAALGGAMAAVARKFPLHKRPREIPIGAVRLAIERGFEQGLAALGERLRERGRAMLAVGDGLAAQASGDPLR
jgi:hypothetical protein